MLVRNKLEHKTCSDGMLLPERISPMHPPGSVSTSRLQLDPSVMSLKNVTITRFLLCLGDGASDFAVRSNRGRSF